MWRQKKATEKGEVRVRQQRAEKGFLLTTDYGPRICEVRPWRTNGHGHDYHYR